MESTSKSEEDASKVDASTSTPINNPLFFLLRAIHYREKSTDIKLSPEERLLELFSSEDTEIGMFIFWSF